MVGYFVFAYFVMGLLSINKYDWMIESGDSVCSIPHQSLSNRILQAGVSALLLIIPLFIALVRNIFIKNRYKITYYIVGILCVILYGGWLFFGRFFLC
ncbi:YjeO family protein [Pectobacterium zantedeschiae]|nr:YjeO family protein [Pectobacterium zantedeschiae]